MKEIAVGTNDIEFRFLTQKFYNDYAHLKEIEQKVQRPYAICVMKIGDHEFAIPLRSHIKHNYLQATLQRKGDKKGLDFSKALIVPSTSYINTNQIPTINTIEFNALKGKKYVIKQKFEGYIKKYKKALEKISENRGSKADVLLVIYSTLQNYHTELGISIDFTPVFLSVNYKPAISSEPKKETIFEFEFYKTNNINKGIPYAAKVYIGAKDQLKKFLFELNQTSGNMYVIVEGKYFAKEGDVVEEFENNDSQYFYYITEKGEKIKIGDFNNEENQTLVKDFLMGKISKETLLKN